MPVFRWGENWNPLHDLEREVEHLLQSMNLTFQGFRFRSQFPAVNLYELENEYLLTAQIPGTSPHDLEITLSGGVLTLRGKRSDTDNVPENRFRRQERFRGEWERSLTLPDRIREEELTAEFNNGVLKVHLPKPDIVKPRRIPVVEGEP